MINSAAEGSVDDGVLQRNAHTTRGFRRIESQIHKIQKEIPRNKFTLLFPPPSLPYINTRLPPFFQKRSHTGSGPGRQAACLQSSTANLLQHHLPLTERPGPRLGGVAQVCSLSKRRYVVKIAADNNDKGKDPLEENRSKCRREEANEKRMLGCVHQVDFAPWKLECLVLAGVSMIEEKGARLIGWMLNLVSIRRRPCVGTFMASMRTMRRQHYP